MGDKHLKIEDAIEMGYPDLRSKRDFKGYKINPQTGNVYSQYWTESQRKSHFRTKQKRIKRYIKIIQRYKTFCGCKTCGFNKHPVALQLNHKDPMQKTGVISDMVRNVGWAKLKEEIRKCEVLCANCHAIHTHEEKQWKVRREEANAKH